MTEPTYCVRAFNAEGQPLWLWLAQASLNGRSWMTTGGWCDYPNLNRASFTSGNLAAEIAARMNAAHEDEGLEVDWHVVAEPSARPSDSALTNHGLGEALARASAATTAAYALARAERRAYVLAVIASASTSLAIVLAIV